MEQQAGQYGAFRWKEIGPVVLIHPTDSEIVGANLINDISDALLDFVRQRKPTKLVISLKHVERYSSEAIGGLVRLERRVRALGGRIKLCMNDDFRELFRVTQLDGTLFEIFDNESEAVASFFESGKDLG